MNGLLTILKYDNLINGESGFIIHLYPHEHYDDRVFNSGLDRLIMFDEIWVD